MKLFRTSGLLWLVLCVVNCELVLSSHAQLLSGRGIAQPTIEQLQKDAAKGNAEAQYNLGACYGNGRGVSTNFVEAFRWYLAAAKQGYVLAQRKVGDYCYFPHQGVAQDFAEAAKWWRKAADSGDSQSQFYLGYLYRNGEGVTKDSAEALKWYLEAAKQGHVKSQLIVGFTYATGEGVTRDYAIAAEWFRRAAEQGDASGEYNLGLCYDKGYGVKQDFAKAVEWYLKAANKGDASAQYNLGACYEDGTGMQKSAAKALEWYRKAADQGNTNAAAKVTTLTVQLKIEATPSPATSNKESGTQTTVLSERGIAQPTFDQLKKSAESGDVVAQNKLGMYYFENRAGLQERKQAAVWFRKAAEKGYAEAQANLALCYGSQGRAVGGSWDENEKLKWYRKAADQGNAAGLYGVGACYFYGSGVDEDKVEAVKWYLKAAEKRDADAQCALGDCYSKGEGVDANDAEALKWYRKAADNGNADAQLKLGDRYAEGNGVKQDKTESQKWYAKAAALGNAEAQGKVDGSYARIQKAQEKADDESFANSPLGKSLAAEGKENEIKEADEKFKQKDYDGALQIVAKVLKTDPDDATALTYRAAIRLQKADADGVIADVKKILEKEPDNQSAPIILASAKFMKNDFGGAMTDLADFTPKGPASVVLVTGYSLRASVKAIKADSKGAKQDYVAARRLLAEFKDPDGNYSSVVSLYKSGLDEFATEAKIPTDVGAETSALDAVFAAENGNPTNLTVIGQLCSDRAFRRFGASDEQGMAEAFQWFRRAAEQGYAPAQFKVGAAYDNGDGVEQDHLEAIKWYRKAAEKGSTEAQADLAKCYFSGDYITQDLVEAAKWYQAAAKGGDTNAAESYSALKPVLPVLKLAQQGDAKSQYDLGRRYFDGDGLKSDKKEAVNWYRKAAEKNYAKAQAALGGCYSKSDGVDKDDAKAVYWYRKAAENNDPEGQAGLGGRFFTGIGVEKNYDEAVKWGRKAADQGSVDGQILLGFCYYYGRGVEKNLGQSENYFNKVFQSRPNEALNIGLIFEHEQEYDLAAKWIRKSADQGNNRARIQLSEYYWRGRGVPKNRDEANRIFEKYVSQFDDDEKQVIADMAMLMGSGFQKMMWSRIRAEAGNAEAQSATGNYFYVSNELVEQDFVQAVYWFRKAAEQGWAEAQNSLGKCYSAGHGVQQNYMEAAKWFRRAAEQGEAVGQFNLGLDYAIGQGVQRDWVEAYMWLNLASAASPETESLDNPSAPDDSKNVATESRRERDKVALRMSAGQIAEAQRRSAEFKPKEESSTKDE